MTKTFWEEAAHAAAHEILACYEGDRDVFVASRATDGDHIAWIESDVRRLRDLGHVVDLSRSFFVSIGTAVLAHADTEGDPRAYTAVAIEVIAQKQHDYGHDNITAFGVQGIVVRLHDKAARLRNLTTRRAAYIEPISDSWLDLFGYAVIGVMLTDGTFTLPLAADAEVPDPDPCDTDDGPEPEPSEEYDETEEVPYTKQDREFVRAVIADEFDTVLEHAVRELARDEIEHWENRRRQAIRHGKRIEVVPEPAEQVPYAPPVPDVGGRDIDPREEAG